MFKQPTIKTPVMWALERINNKFPEITAKENGIGRVMLDYKDAGPCKIIAVRKDLLRLVKDLEMKTKSGNIFKTDKYVFKVKETNIWTPKGFTFEIENNGIRYIVLRLKDDELSQELSSWLITNPDNEFARLANKENFLFTSTLIC